MPEAGILEIVSRVGGIGGLLAVIVLYMAYTALTRTAAAYNTQQRELLDVVNRNTEAITKHTDALGATRTAVDELAQEVRWMKGERNSPRVYEDLMVGLDLLMRQQREGAKEPVTATTPEEVKAMVDARRAIREKYSRRPSGSG